MRLHCDNGRHGPPHPCVPTEISMCQPIRHNDWCGVTLESDTRGLGPGENSRAAAFENKTVVSGGVGCSVSQSPLPLSSLLSAPVPAELNVFASGGHRLSLDRERICLSPLICSSPTLSSCPFL